MRGALLFGALVGPALAVPALAPRTDPPSPSTIATSTSGKGFSCQVVQEARCCATVTVVAGRAVGTSCAAAFGGIGYATCLAGETPLCGAAASADGTETGLAPSNTQLPAPACGSAIANLAKGVFTCPVSLVPACCDAVTLATTNTCGGPPANLATGCVAAAGSAKVASCASPKLAYCANAQIVAGAATGGTFPGVIPRGK